MEQLVTMQAALTGAGNERGEVNTAAILAWTVLAVVAILGIQIAFDGLVTDVFDDVKGRILGHT